MNFLSKDKVCKKNTNIRAELWIIKGLRLALEKINNYIYIKTNSLVGFYTYAEGRQQMCCSKDFWRT